MVEYKGPPVEIMQELGKYYNASIVFGRESSQAKQIIQANEEKYKGFSTMAKQVDGMVKSLCRKPWGLDGLGR